MNQCNAISLVCTVKDTRQNRTLDCIIFNIFSRLKKVVFLINEEKGGNDIAETRCDPNEDVKFDFGKNIEFWQDDGKMGEFAMNDDGGEMEIEFEAI